jgi:LuxR family maltose regulon positive regulatory protein
MDRGVARIQREPSGQPTPKGVSAAHGVVVRDDLLATLDSATAHKVTVVSAPPGSGKTWLLRAWSERSRGNRRVAFVSVERDQRDPQQFWLSVLRAIRQSLPTAAEARPESATPAFDGQAMIDRILFETQ